VMEGDLAWSRCMSVLAPTVMHATPSTPAVTNMVTRERRPTVATILIIVDATIVAKTRAQALTYRGPRLSIGTSSTWLSHRAIDR